MGRNFKAWEIEHTNIKEKKKIMEKRLNDGGVENQHKRCGANI